MELTTVKKAIRKRARRKESGSGTQNNQQLLGVSSKEAVSWHDKAGQQITGMIHAVNNQKQTLLSRTHRVYLLRGQAVILEHDLAFILGTIPAKLSWLASRKPQWFPYSERYTITEEESAVFDFWWQRVTPDYLSGHSESICAEASPQMPVVYTLQAVIAATHLLTEYAQEEVDHQPIEYDLLDRFRKLKREMEKQF